MPSLNQVYRAPLLTDAMVRYRNDNFIAEQVFPVLPVTKEQDYIFVFDKENLRAPKNSQRGLYDRAERVDYGLSQVAMPTLVERALEQPVSWKVKNQAQDPLQPEISATNNLAEKIAIEKEVALSTYLANTANVTQNTTLSGTSQWSDYTNSHPLVAIQSAADTILQNSLKKPNVAVMGRQVFSQLVNHPDVTDRIKYTARADQATIANALADLLGVDRVYIGTAGQNTAVEGQTDSVSFIWGKNFWLMYVAPIPAIETVSAGYHLIIPEERYVDTWTEQPIKSDLVRVNDYYTRYTMAVECMYLYKNAVA
jgi:hypothetical protein